MSDKRESIVDYLLKCCNVVISGAVDESVTEEEQTAVLEAGIATTIKSIIKHGNKKQVSGALKLLETYIDKTSGKEKIRAAILLLSVLSRGGKNAITDDDTSGAVQLPMRPTKV